MVTFSVIKGYYVLNPDFRVYGHSMSPTLYSKSKIGGTRFFDIERHKIYMINDDGIAESEALEHPDGRYIKRIVALPGDTLTLELSTGNLLSLNGTPVSETRNENIKNHFVKSKLPVDEGKTLWMHGFTVSFGTENYETYRAQDGENVNSGVEGGFLKSIFSFPWMEKNAINGIVKITLSDDQYFALSDNRVLGVDSRHFGPVTKSNIDFMFNGKVIQDGRGVK